MITSSSLEPKKMTPRTAAPRHLQAIRMLDADPLSPEWRTSLERDRSDAAAAKLGISTPQLGRYYIDLNIERRDLTVASGGGSIVGTTSADTFFPSLQGSSIAMRLGAQLLPMTSDNLALPAITTPPTTQWLAAEGTQISTNQPVIGARAAAPKSVAALVSFSHQLARQASPAAESVLMSELGRAIAAAVDSAVFNGTGADGQPTGLLSLSGTQTTSGATFTWAMVTDLIEKPGTAGAPMLSPGFATTPAVREILMTREITSGQGVPITTDANRLGGFPLQASKSGPASAVIFADWANVLVPTWGVLELQVDPFTGFKSGLISMRAILQTDTLFAHPSTVAIRTSVS
jgi:HK97 family phage major capsid protein